MDQTINCESIVRIGHSLNEAERQHVTRRKETVKQCLQRHNINTDEIPNIAVLGSGGGLRAMVGLLGSLSQLHEEGLLDSIMYLSGVSGSTWCMASLYKEQDWSTNLKTVKDNITHRLADQSVSCNEKWQKLKKYSENPNFSLTDVWAVLIVADWLKEIDEHSLTEQRGKYTNDPYPIYTVVDKQCKHADLKKDPWFEITPDESGYSLTGAFVDSSCLGSEFKDGKKIKDQPEIDMLYLQGLCGSAIAEWTVIDVAILKELLKYLLKSTQDNNASHAPDVEHGCQVVSELLHLIICALSEEDPSLHFETMNNLMKDKCDETGNKLTPPQNLMMSERTTMLAWLKEYTLRVCHFLYNLFKGHCLLYIISCCIEKVIMWTWGTTYNYLDNMTVGEVDHSILSSEIREFEDAGLLLNSPYFSVLRKERDIDLIISLDFSSGDPFKTVDLAAEKCADLEIQFPEVDKNHQEPPSDFYVYKGPNVPTVIHIPLFNTVNCNGEVETWTKNYETSKGRYSHKEILDLLEKAGLNIKNNKEKLLTEIKNITEQKKTSMFE